MFRAALSSLSSSVAGAIKNTAAEYHPSNVGGAFERIAQQSIANLSYRSPILADVAQTTLHNFQLEVAKKNQINEYVKSDESKGLREVVRTKLGDSASTKKIDAEMSNILSKIGKSIDKFGEDETKKTSLFQEYEKYFKEFRKEKPKDNSGGATANSPIPTDSPEGNSSRFLSKIEANTNRIVNVLELLATKQSVLGVASGDGEAPKTTGSDVSFIDPVTGMPSMRAAVGSIGGSFLAKIFDDATIEKFAKKTRKMFHLDDELEMAPEKTEALKKSLPTIIEETKKIEAKVSPATPGANISSIDEILKGLSLDLNSDVNEQAVIPNTSENSRELEMSADKRAEKLQTVNEGILEEVKKFNEGKASIDAKKDEGITSIFSNFSKTITESLGPLMKSLGPIMSSIGSLLGPAAGVLAAGAAGAAVGTYVVNPLLNKAATAITGKENTVGTALYDWMNKDQIDPTKPVTQAEIDALRKKRGDIISVKKDSATTVAELTTMNDKKKAEDAVKASQPIVLSSTNNTEASQNSTPPMIMGSLSVRNHESTFERIQMQSFWPRAF